MVLYRIMLLTAFIGLLCQHSLSGQTVKNDAFAKKLTSLIKYSVPLIDVEQACHERDDYLWLDIRELDEYRVSHIAKALYVSYDNPQWAILDTLPKHTKIIVYCSVGYRSEKFGEKLKARGFSQVYNLYGSIFEWANRAYPLVDDKGNKTLELHTYNRDWSRWVDNPSIKKRW